MLQKGGFGIVTTLGRQECETFPNASAGALFSYNDISDILSHAGLGGTTSGSLTVKSATARYDLVNNSNAPIYVKFHKCLARRDLELQAGSLNYSTPEAAFRYGIKDQQVDTTWIQYRIPGVTPYMVQSFCQHWKIMGKAKSFWLPPGGLKTVFIKRKNVRINRITINAPGIIVFKGLTVCPLILVRGVQGRNSLANEWSYGQAELSCIRTETYKFMDTVGLMQQNPDVYSASETNYVVAGTIERITPHVPVTTAGYVVGTLL